MTIEITASVAITAGAVKPGRHQQRQQDDAGADGAADRGAVADRAEHQAAVAEQRPARRRST